MPNEHATDKTDSVDDPFDRTHAVFVSGPDGTGHPYVILSTDAFPEHGHRYLAVPLTSEPVEYGITIEADDWNVGGREKPSYAAPNRIGTIAHGEIEAAIGAVSAETVDEIVAAIGDYLGLPP